ncbi:MAG: hypothetical protein AAGA57_10390, partial [Planctomycetota bacterium]
MRRGWRTMRATGMHRALAVLLGVAALAGGAVGEAGADDGAGDGLSAAGEAEAAWVVVPWRDGPDGWRASLLHGEVGSAGDADGWVNLNGGRAAGALRRAGTLSGRLMPAGLAGDGDRAVVLFRNGSLMAVNAERQESTGLWRYEREVLPSLPIDGRAVAATVADGRVWVLIRGRGVEVKTSEVVASGA